MGRTKTKKQVGSTKPKDTPPTPGPAAPSVSALLEKAQSLIVQCDYELAARFIKRALEQQPTNAQGKEMLGVVQLEMGDIDAAKQVGLLHTCPVLITRSNTSMYRRSPAFYRQIQTPLRLRLLQLIYILLK